MIKWRAVAVLLASGVCALGAPVDAEAIYDRLAKASGEWRKPPALHIRTAAEQAGDRSGQRVAWFDAKRNTIFVDQKTMDLCAAIPGKQSDCVAFLLGHELAHFYRRHNWANEFSTKFAGTDTARLVGEQAPSGERRLVYEAEADVTAGYYAYLAGLDGLGAAAVILPRIYRSYEIPAEVAGYPSLADRVRIAGLSARKLANLIPMFEAGNVLFFAGRYEESARTLDALAQEFPSSEILNNAGVGWAIAAGDLALPLGQAKAYPWTVDGHSRLDLARSPRDRGGLGADDTARHARYAEVAAERFQKALQQDADYLPAALNLACLDRMMGKKGTANDRMEEIQKTFGKSNNGELVAEVAGSLEKGPALTDPVRPAGERLEDEAVQGLLAWEPDLSDRPLLFEVRAEGAGEGAITVRSKRTPGYLALEVQSRAMEMRAIVTSPEYAGETKKGLRAGSAWGSVAELYPAPTRVRRLRAGECRIYDPPGLILCSDDGVRLSRWTIFKIRSKPH